MASNPKRVEHDFKLSKVAHDHGTDEIVPNKQRYWRILLFSIGRKVSRPNTSLVIGTMYMQIW